MNGQPQRILSVERDIDWLPKPNELTLIVSETLPDPTKVTSALALAFRGNRILMTRLDRRGWDIPGGHIEAGETMEQALRREVYEESAATLGRVRLFCCQRVRVLGPVPAGYRYPVPDSYQALFVAQVDRLDEFLPTDEVRERRLFTPAEAAELPWAQKNRLLYDTALAQVSSVEFWEKP